MSWFQLMFNGLTTLYCNEGLVTMEPGMVEPHPQPEKRPSPRDVPSQILLLLSVSVTGSTGEREEGGPLTLGQRGSVCGKSSG